MMAYKKKWKKGIPIRTIDEVVLLYKWKHFIWAHGKAYHFGWWSGWSLQILSGMISRGAIFYAERT